MTYIQNQLNRDFITLNGTKATGLLYGLKGVVSLIGCGKTVMRGLKDGGQEKTYQKYKNFNKTDNQNESTGA